MTNYAAGEPYARQLTRLSSRLKAHIRTLIDVCKRWPDSSDTPARWMALGRLEAAVQLTRDSDELCNAVEDAWLDLERGKVTESLRGIAMDDMYAVQRELRRHAERMRQAILGAIS